MTTTLFPMQFQRQDSTAIDQDAVFLTTASRIAYLTSPRRYAGQIVTDLEQERVYFLNALQDAWIPIGSMQFKDEGINLGSPDASSVNFAGVGVTATRTTNVVDVAVPTSTNGISKWSEWLVSSIILPMGSTAFSNSSGVSPVAEYTATPASTAVAQLGETHYTSGSYYFEPESGSIGTKVLYSVGLNVRIAVSGVEGTCLLTLVGKSSPTGDLTTDLLFRHDITVMPDTNGIYYHNVDFSYLHTSRSDVKIYLYFVDNTSTGTSFTVDGLWTLFELGRIPIPLPVQTYASEDYFAEDYVTPAQTYALEDYFAEDYID